MRVGNKDFISKKVYFVQASGFGRIVGFCVSQMDCRRKYWTHARVDKKIEWHQTFMPTVSKIFSLYRHSIAAGRCYSVFRSWTALENPKNQENNESRVMRIIINKK